MKTLLITLLALTVNLSLAQDTKKVCNKQKDNKGKEVQVCKEIKVHKKLDSATKVPPK